MGSYLRNRFSILNSIKNSADKIETLKGFSWNKPQKNKAYEIFIIIGFWSFLRCFWGRVFDYRRKYKKSLFRKRRRQNITFEIICFFIASGVLHLMWIFCFRVGKKDLILKLQKLIFNFASSWISNELTELEDLVQKRM